jgi:hypothetical protein
MRSHTQKEQKLVEFPTCYHYAFNHLKAEPKSNRFWYSCHPNVYQCAFNHLKAKQISNGYSMLDILLIYVTD